MTVSQPMKWEVGGGGGGVGGDDRLLIHTRLLGHQVSTHFIHTRVLYTVHVGIDTSDYGYPMLIIFVCIDHCVMALLSIERPRFLLAIKCSLAAVLRCSSFDMIPSDILLYIFYNVLSQKFHLLCAMRTYYILCDMLETAVLCYHNDMSLKWPYC